MAYTPDPTDTTNPLDTVDASTAAAEFRALKGYISTLVGGPGFAAVNIFRKNAIIGGDFDTNPWQRGTNFVGILDGAYSADRWKRRKTGTMVEDVTKTADVPTLGVAYKNKTMDIFSVNCFQANVTTAEAALAAADFSLYSHRIEGYNWRQFAQNPITLSFWHKHTKAGIYCVSIQNAGLVPDRSYIAEYTQAVADTWEFDSITFPASPAAGTWDYVSGIGLAVNFIRGCGATQQSAPGVWTVGNFLSSPNQVNSLDAIGNKFRIALVQLEAATIASKFEYRSFEDELMLCQRYYQKSFIASVAPAQAAGFGGEALIGSYRAGAVFIVIPVNFGVPMRTSGFPVVTLYNPGAANAQVRDETGLVDCSASVANALSNRGFYVSCTGNAATAVGNLLGVHWTADFEL